MLFCSIIILHRGDNVSDRKGLASTQGPALPGPGDTPRGLTRTGSPETFQKPSGPSPVSVRFHLWPGSALSERGASLTSAWLLRTVFLATLRTPKVWPENSIQGQDAGTKEEHVTQAKSSSTQAGRGVTGCNIVYRFRNKLYFVTNQATVCEPLSRCVLGCVSIDVWVQGDFRFVAEKRFSQRNCLNIYLFDGNKVHWPTSVSQRSTLGSQFSSSTI